MRAGSPPVELGPGGAGAARTGRFPLVAAQILLVVVFGLGALVKGTQTTARAVELGMTGSSTFHSRVMRFIAVCELLGIIGLVLHDPGPGHRVAAAALIRDDRALLCRRRADRAWHPGVRDSSAVTSSTRVAVPT